MDAFTALVTRRSIRKYADRPVSDDELEKILTAAMLAPSAVNKQPWHFLVIDDAEILSEIPEIHPNAKMATGAPCAILVCGDLELAHGPGYLPQDCAAATENILLAAHALGLGGVWCGIYSRPDRESGFRSLFSLPDTIVPFGLVVLGYPAEKRPQPDRYQPDRVHRNAW